MLSDNLKIIVQAAHTRCFLPSVLYDAFCAINIASYNEELEECEDFVACDHTNLYIIEYFRNHLSDYLTIIDYFSPDNNEDFSYSFCKANNLCLQNDTYQTMMEYTQSIWPLLRENIITCLASPDFPCPVYI